MITKTNALLNFPTSDRSMENTGTAIICILDSLAGRCDSFCRLCGIQLRQGAEAGSGSYVAAGEPVDL